MSVTDCDSVYGPGAGHLDERGVGGNPYPYAECTWYCWQYFHDVHQVDLPAALGNATDWTTSAHREQWQVDMTPQVGRIACWSASRYPDFGHVAVILELTPGGFRVGEMNFVYYAREDPSLAGKIDCREVTDLTGITGFLTPHGVTPGGGTSETSTLLAALTPGFQGIAGSIAQAGLFVEAEVMTAGLRIQSIGQVGGGMLVMGAGGVLGALSAAGHGDPGRGAQVLRAKLPRRRPELVTPAPEPNWTAAERSWLSAALAADEHADRLRTRRIVRRASAGRPAGGK